MGNIPFVTKKIENLELIQALEERVRDASARHHLRCGQLHLIAVPEILLEESELTELLKTIDFNGNNLQYLPQMNLPKLTDINLWGNNMTDMMFAPYRKKQGKGKMKGKLIIEFDEENPQEEMHAKLGCFSMMPSLENVDLDNNQITFVPPSLSLAKNLDQLHLMGNKLTDASSSLYAITNLHKITYLDLNYNRFTKIPLERLTNKKLLTLLLQGNYITVITSQLSEITSLQKLNIADNIIKTIEEGAFDNLTSLKSLYLFNNQISKFPEDSFKSLESLTHLLLNNNKLNSFPSSISSLVHLRLLNLSNNRIEELPNLEGLSCLTELDLSSNTLYKLPLSFGYLTELRTLNLSYNNLSNLPITFGYLIYLSSLSLIGNNFSISGDTSPLLLPPFQSVEFQSMIHPNNGFILNEEKGKQINIIDVTEEKEEKKDEKKEEKKKRKKKSQNHNNNNNNNNNDNNNNDNNNNNNANNDGDNNVAINNNNNIISDSNIELQAEEIGLKPLWSLTMIEELDLSFNNLSSLPSDAFEKMLRLTKIGLSYNQLNNQTLPVLFNERNNEGVICNIEAVFLNGNQLNEFPHNQLAPLRRSLRKLSIDENPILSIPSIISEYSLLSQFIVSAPLPLPNVDQKPPKKQKRKISKRRSLELDNKHTNNGDISIDLLPHQHHHHHHHHHHQHHSSASKFFPPELSSLKLKRLLVGNYYDKEPEEIGLDKEMILNGVDILHHPSYPSFSASPEIVGKFDHNYPFGFAITKGTSSHPIEDCISLHTFHLHYPVDQSKEKNSNNNNEEEEVIVQYIGVFDGHGGSDVSLFLQSNLHRYFFDKLQSLFDNPFTPQRLSTLYSIFQQVFAEANVDIYHHLEKENKLQTPMGSTAVVLLITNDFIYCINAGDSRAVLASASPNPSFLPYPSSIISHNNNNENSECDHDQLHYDNDNNLITITELNSHQFIDSDTLINLNEALNYDHNHLQSHCKSIRLSVDHKPHLHVEVEKIRKRKAFVMPDASGSKGARLGIAAGPAIAVSRAFGDFYLGVGITNEPHLLTLRVDLSNDLFILAGSDGVWDVISDIHAIQFAMKIFFKYLPIVSSPSLICSIVASRLRDLVLSLCSGDDVSVVVFPLPAMVNILSKRPRSSELPSSSVNPFAKTLFSPSPNSSQSSRKPKQRKKKRSQSNIHVKKKSKTISALNYSVT